MSTVKYDYCGIVDEKSKISHIISLIIGGVIIAGIFYIGYRTAYIRYENAEPAIITQTFYATISEITEDTVTVTGMDVNDINFRGEFVFGIEKKQKLFGGTRILHLAI